MYRLGALVAAWIAISGGIAHAQAPQANTPEGVRMLLDVNRFRVSAVVIKPGAKIDLPNRPNQFAYLLTDATLVFSRPGRTPYEMTFKAGEATLLPTQSTHAQNGGDREVRAVFVEIKDGARPSRRSTSKKGRKTMRIDVRGAAKK